MKKILAYTLFSILIALSILMIIITILNRDVKGEIDWNTITSSISVIATCIIAVTTFNLV